MAPTGSDSVFGTFENHYCVNFRFSDPPSALTTLYLLIWIQRNLRFHGNVEYYIDTFLQIIESITPEMVRDIPELSQALQLYSNHDIKVMPHHLFTVSRSLIMSTDLPDPIPDLFRKHYDRGEEIIKNLQLSEMISTQIDLKLFAIPSLNPKLERSFLSTREITRVIFRDFRLRHGPLFTYLSLSKHSSVPLFGYYRDELEKKKAKLFNRLINLQLDPSKFQSLEQILITYGKNHLCTLFPQSWKSQRRPRSQIIRFVFLSCASN